MRTIFYTNDSAEHAGGGAYDCVLSKSDVFLGIPVAVKRGENERVL